MPAAPLAERFGRWLGPITPLDDDACEVLVGAERVEDMAAYLGPLGADLTVSEPPERVEQMRVLAGRFAAATS